jgi:hypothetical protein
VMYYQREVRVSSCSREMRKRRKEKRTFLEAPASPFFFIWLCFLLLTRAIFV